MDPVPEILCSCLELEIILKIQKSRTLSVMYHIRTTRTELLHTLNTELRTYYAMRFIKIIGFDSKHISLK
jgi:hypothetical protein